MKTTTLIIPLLALFLLSEVQAQTFPNKLSQTFTSPDSSKIKAKIFDSLFKLHKLADGPDRVIDPFLKIKAFDHPGFGTFIVGLKDVNGDGYNDFAVSTPTDTTFIFFGGPNMDDKPDAFVLGGGSGIVAGDINGDGYTDIATAQFDYQNLLDPDSKGLIRIYLHNKTGTMYNAQPDLQIVGRNVRSRLGKWSSGYYHLKGGDVNEDGILDLIIYSQDLNGANGVGRGVLYLYLGKAIPDTIPDYEFKDWNHVDIRDSYGNEFQITDINNDGFDDIIIKGISIKDGKNIIDRGIFLGNAQAKYDSIPDRLMTYYKDNLNNNDRIDYTDMNGDGCPEIYYHSDQPYPPFAWGYSGLEFFTIQDFIPHATFTNEEPSILAWANSIDNVGNFSGSGFNDYFVGWAVSFQQQILGTSSFLYRGGPGWQSKAIAYFGNDATVDMVCVPPIPIGDITGDNFDDFALITGYYNPTEFRYWPTVWLFKGDKTLTQTSVDYKPSTPDDFHMIILPNPVFVGKDNKVSIRGDSPEIGDITLTLFDILGREIKKYNKELYQKGAFQFQINVIDLRPGIFYIDVRSKTKRTTNTLTILN